MENVLEKKSRSERLRELRDRINRGEKLTAFGLAVEYGRSLNVIYRDVETLRLMGAIPSDWKFERQ